MSAWAKLVLLLGGSTPYRRLSLAFGFGYLLLFLVALGDISRGATGMGVATAPWPRMFERTGAFTFEAIARVSLSGVTVLVSPVNILIGSAIASLAGLNLALALMALRSPERCGFGVGSGPLAAVPALLAGGACCAPTLLVVLGVQASALLLIGFRILLPLSIGALMASLKYTLDRVAPGPCDRG